MKKEGDIFTKAILVLIFSSLFIYLIFLQQQIPITGAPSANVSVSVYLIGNPPVLDSIGNQQATVGHQYSKTVTATDPNNDTLTFSDNTSLFQINSTSGLIQFTPELSDLGKHNVEIVVRDIHQNGDSEVVQFEVKESSGSSGGSSSGGGGSGFHGEEYQDYENPEGYSFDLDIDHSSVYLNPGGTTRKTIIITNTEGETQEFTLDIKGIEEFLKLSDFKFILKPGESKTVNVDFIAPLGSSLDAYTGKIIVKTKSASKEIGLSLGIESPEALFDISIEIPEEFKEVLPGKKVLGQISLFNLGLLKRADVVVEYVVKDLEDNVIAMEQKTLAVETQASLLAELDLPSNIKPGVYVFAAKVKFNEEIATSTTFFTVIPQKKIEVPLNIVTYYLGFIVALLLTVLLLITYYLKGNSSIESKKLDIRDQLKPTSQKKLKKTEEYTEKEFIKGILKEALKEKKP
ncbi:MAG: hypothetical protein HYS32_03290 [Candidatus Woesearchaeota archaeon]|nr:MAG: hypothetical protein HYS32_03290 [Candidatus Woesearchaeota archaeon]